MAGVNMICICELSNAIDYRERVVQYAWQHRVNELRNSSLGSGYTFVELMVLQYRLGLVTKILRQSLGLLE